MTFSLRVRLVLAIGLAIAAASASASANEAAWTGREIVNLYFRYHNGWVPLPHLRDKDSSALFFHLVDSGNIARIEMAPISNGEKLAQLRIILATLGAYRAAYNSAVLVGEPLEEELTLIQAYAILVASHVAKHAQLLADASASPAAWATLVEGVIESIGDDKFYSPRQKAIMADAIARHYPAIAAALSEDERRRIRVRVLALTDAGGNGDLSEARKRMKRTILQPKFH